MTFRIRTCAIALAMAGVAISSAQVPVIRLPAWVFKSMSESSVPIRPPVPVKENPKPTTPPIKPANTSGPLVVPPPTKPPAKKKPTAAQWFNEMVLNRLDFSGRRVLSYHQHTVTGDREAFDTLNYYGQGDRQFTNSGQLNISGKKVAGILDFSASVRDDRLNNPDDQKLTLTYKRGPASVALGDINASLLNTNRFTRLSRSVNGGELGWKSGRVEAKALRSETRGSARTISTEGNNSVGPYYLQGGKIRPDTLEVEVDGVRQKLGTDFDLDTEIGAITFISRVISPTNTIVATYESSAFNETRGTLQGAGMAYDLGKAGRVGVTWIEQIGRGAASTSTKVELFQGRGNPGVGYDLDYDPVPGTVVLRVGSIAQVPNADYFFDAKYPRRFYMTRFIDLNQTIAVTYQPVGIISVDGDRRTYGFDYRLPFGKTGDRGYMQLSQATGGFIGGTSGQARGIEIEQREKQWTFRTSFRDVPSEYVSVESRGFERNERVHDWSAVYDADRISYQVGGNNSSVFVRNASNNSVGSARYTTLNGGLKYSDPDGTRWSLDHVHLKNRYTDETNIDTTSISGRRQFGRVDTSLGLQYQTGSGPITTDNVTKVGPLQVASIVGTADWSAGRGLTFGSRLSLNDIKALDQHGKGYDANLNIGWKPSDMWRFGANIAQSDSGDLPSIGINTGYGLGYNGGNGFSGGSTADQLLVGASSLKRVALSTEYRANSRLTLNGRWQQYRAEGDLSSNADNRSYGVGASFDLGKSTFLSTSIDRSNTNFIGSSGSSEATTFSTSISGSPPGNFSYNFGVVGLISQGSSSSIYRQDSLSYDASLSYRLASRHRVNFGFSRGRTTGYYGQDESSTSISYDYQIYRTIALRAGYTWRNVANLDPVLSSGTYRSSGIDIELIFDFAR